MIQSRSADGSASLAAARRVRATLVIAALWCIAWAAGGVLLASWRAFLVLPLLGLTPLLPLLVGGALMAGVGARSARLSLRLAPRAAPDHARLTHGPTRT